MLLPQLCFNRLRPVLFRRRCGSGKYKIRQLPDALSRGGAEDSTNVADDRNVKSGTVTTTVESGNGEGELAVLIVNSWLGFISTSHDNPSYRSRNARRVEAPLETLHVALGNRATFSSIGLPPPIAQSHHVQRRSAFWRGPCRLSCRLHVP
jgi:hypothetical protein